MTTKPRVRPCRAADPENCTHHHPEKKGPVTVSSLFDSAVKKSAKPKSFTSHKQLMDYYKQAHPGVMFELKESYGFVVLDAIIIPKTQRRLGLGSKMMKDLIDAADKNNWPLALTPDSVYGTPQGQLEKFYRSFGFVKNAGRKRDFSTQESMIRYPN
jgi:hypothetical protein